MASPKEGEKVRIAHASLTLEVEHSWKGLDGGTSEVIPWFRYNSSVHPIRRYSLGPRFCEQTEQRCETTFRIEIERQGPPAEGTVDVHWKATGYAAADEAKGSNLEVHLVRL
ncbi:hypothetical protein F0U61_44450 [Archangium violaceum]|uniref:hypothetical protein n=1 Tax=Archangium violaceum TaxID=83451 RepID=UPI002B2DF39D|nr:hypothetical protein F0U61_44450 [Archangium violaceum]